MHRRRWLPGSDLEIGSGTTREAAGHSPGGLSSYSRSCGLPVGGGAAAASASEEAGQVRNDQPAEDRDQQAADVEAHVEFTVGYQAPNEAANERARNAEHDVHQPALIVIRAHNLAGD